jgi:hypothetical protein
MATLQNIITETPRIGLNLASDPIALREGEYTYMLNGCLFDVDGKAPFARMFRGNRKVVDLPVGFHIVGHANISQKETCLFLVDPSTGVGEIGLFDKVSYRTVASSLDMGFRIDRQIQAVVDEDFNGSKTVIWVQVDAPIRFMNLNNPPMLNGVLDIEALNVFRQFDYPVMRVSEITNGGRLIAGAYYISTQYADENGNGLTNCTTPVGPVFIYRDAIVQPIGFINGSPEREQTDKAIRITLSNLDQSFKYINVVVVKSFSGTRLPFVVGTIPTSQTSFLYTGNIETEKPMLLEEVIAPGVSYDSAKTIALSNGTCLIGNLKGKADYNFQPYISKIAVQWQLQAEKYDSSDAAYTNPLKSLYELQYRRNEVYDLGIAIRWKDGTKTRVYPLIAREKDKNSDGSPITKTIDQYGQAITGGWDSGPAPLNDDLYETTGSIPRYKVANTAFVAGEDALVGGEGPWLYGEMGYWENTSDRYPLDSNIWGKDAGQPIRRFMMPDHSVAPLIDGENKFNTDSYVSTIYRLGLRFDNIEDVFASMPADIKAKIGGYELVRADRRNNKSVIGSGLLYNMWYKDWSGAAGDATFTDLNDFGLNSGSSDVRLYPNYPLNDLRPDGHIRKMVLGNFDNPNFPPYLFPQDLYRKDIFTFVSPDTSFNKNMLFSGDLYIHKEMYGVAKNLVAFAEPYPQFRDRQPDDSTQSAYHNLVLGYYNNWKKGIPGQLRRKITEAMYVPFNAQVGGGLAGLPIHNLTRESSVFLYLGKILNDPSIIDTSRTNLGDPDFGCNIYPPGPRYRNASAFYASIISRISNQYGGVFDPRYMYTNQDSTTIRNKKPVFGGDTYIAPFSIKRQFAYFQNVQSYIDFENSQEGIDLKNTSTIPTVMFFYEAIRKNANLDSVTECEGSTQFGGNRIGYLPLFSTGIPIAFFESDYNVDLRINGVPEWETYYPNLKDATVKLGAWTGVKNLDKDNYYGMNESYNEQNDLYAYLAPDPFFNPLVSSKTHYSTRTIFSLPGAPENRFNNLLVFLPLNYHDFPRDTGELTDIRDVGNYEVVFRLEHSFYRSRIHGMLASSEGNITLGSGRIFETTPMRLATTEGGYAGSNEQWAFNTTPFGAFCTDAVRKTCLAYTEKLNDIGINDAAPWLDENMPFNLLKDVPNFPNKDNPANPEGIGYLSIFDSVSRMWILTKIDYELIDKNLKGSLTIVDGKLHLNNGPVSLKDTAYFRDRSWTFCYSPLTQKWVTWLSFKHRYYFQMDTSMYSFADGAIWAYDNPNPRTFNGKRYPFQIEVVLKSQSLQMSHVSSFLTRVFPIKGGVMQGEDPKDTFSKASVYNMYQHTGQYMLTVQDENNLHDLVRMPLSGNDFREVFPRRMQQVWNIDQLFDLVADPAKPFFLPGWEKEIDHGNINYNRDYKEAVILRDMWSKHRYTYDKDKDVQLYLYLVHSLIQISGK